MIGTNVLILNQDTMCAALEYWLKNTVFRGQLHDTPDVTNIAASEDGFKVTLEQAEEEEDDEA